MSWFSRAAFAAAFFVCAGSVVQAQAPGEHLVVVDPAKTNVALAAATIRFNTGAQVEIVAEKIGVLKMIVPPQLNAAGVQGVVAAASNVNGVKSVEPTSEWTFFVDPASLKPYQPAVAGSDVESFATTPNDPGIPEMWFLQTIDAFKAWDTRTTSSIKVAVLDSGYHLQHQDLANQWWVNPGEAPFGVNGVDNDGNGLVDDLIGWDFQDNDNGAFCELFELQPGFIFWEFHGSHVAGSIGATGNDGIGITGMCWDVEMIPLRVGAGLSVNVAAAISAMQYAADNGAKVINCSFGGPGNASAFRAAVRYAEAKGALVVCAAGNSSSDNDASPVYPAALEEPNLLTVAATDSTQKTSLTDFSNFGQNTVDLAAPGRDILSTMPEVDNLSGRVDAYYFLEGTSMASPITAGTAALVWANWPSLTYADVKEILKISVDRYPPLYDKCESGGRLNVHKAMRFTLPNGAPTAGVLNDVTIECKGGTNRVTFRVTVDDPDEDEVAVQWIVDGEIQKTQFNVLPGTQVVFQHDFPHGESVVEFLVTDFRELVDDSATVIVQDTKKPRVTVTPTVTLKVNRGETYATRNRIPKPKVVDACDPTPRISNNAKPRLSIGTHNVIWTVVDDEGNRTTARQRVRVVNTPPKANAGRDLTLTTRTARASAQLNGSGSRDADGHTLKYRWSGTGVRFSNPTAVRPTASFPVGTTTVTLTVTDEAGARSTDKVRVVVRRLRGRSASDGLADTYAGAAYARGYQSAASRAYDPAAVEGYRLAEQAYLLGQYAGDDDADLRQSQAATSRAAAERLLASYAESGDADALLAGVYSYYGAVYGDAGAAD